MTLQTIENLFYNPHKIFANIKKLRRQTRNIAIIDVLLLTASAAILTSSPELVAVAFGISAVAILLKAFLVEIIFLTLGGKGKFEDGLATIAYPAFMASLGVLVFSVFLKLVPYLIGIGYLALTILLAYSLALLYQAAKQIFRVDYIRALIGIGILVSSIYLAISASIFLTIIKTFIVKIVPA